MVVAGDQWVKALVARSLPPGTSVPVLPGLVSLTHTQNTGVAFGLFAGISPLITALAAVVLLALLFSHRGRWLQTRAAGVGVALMAGGAIGNLLDRVRLGFVVDYIDFHVWPVFNLADAAIVVGAGLMVLVLARDGRPAHPRR